MIRISTVSALAALALLPLSSCSTGTDDLSAPSTTELPATAPPTTSSPTTETPTTEAGTADTCPTVIASSELGRIANTDLIETSGLATSTLNPDILWAHNDSGSAASLYAVGRDGTDLGEYPLGGVTNRDWEDMARWLDPVTGTSWLYVGDIGDNVGQWESIFVHRVPEPVVTEPAAAGRLDGVETFEFTYPEGKPNAETLLVDPLTGTITIVTKSPGAPARVFEATGAVPGTTHELAEVGSLDLGMTLDGTATAGDHSGDHVFIRTYLAVLAYPTQSGPWWNAEPCEMDPPFEIQGESLAVEPDESGYVTVSEGARARLNHSELD
jgi:hypothetical protein